MGAIFTHDQAVHLQNAAFWLVRERLVYERSVTNRRHT